MDEDEDSDTEDDNAPSHSYTSPNNDSSASAGVVRRALSRGPSALPQHMVNERAPLLGETSRANSKTRVGRRGAQGDASVMQALLMVGSCFRLLFRCHLLVECLMRKRMISC